MQISTVVTRKQNVLWQVTPLRSGMTAGSVRRYFGSFTNDNGARRQVPENGRQGGGVP